MANRVFYAVQAVGIAPFSTNDFKTVHGVQSVGITTTFNLEQVFELGQLSIYENIENIPDIEVTLEKVLDGYPLLYHLCTSGHTSDTLVGRSAKRCQVALSIYDDTQDAASGVPVSQVDMSGMYLSSVTYTIPTDGNCTESVTLVGNDKVWRDSGFTFQPTAFDTLDQPLALTFLSASGGIQRRENVKFDAGYTLLPSGTGGIPGITSGRNDKTNDVYDAHISQITVSADLGREAINELGRRAPYYRFVNFPVEVTTDIEVITIEGDKVDATENTSLTNQRIYVCLQDGTVIDTGTTNKLSSITYGGGDTGGGQATVTYSYSNFNVLTVTHPTDPG